MDERGRLVEELYAERRAEAVRLAWGLTGDAALAQEIAQEAFVRLYVHRRRLLDPTAAPAYLRRTVVNLVYSNTRRRRREVRPDDVPASPSESQPHHPTDDRPDDRVDLLAALATLPPRRRACIVLRYYLDLTEAETAASLGTSVGTVKSQTHKALAQLRVRLEPLEPAFEQEDPA
jgi:RNA polymerase sigma-70 factor (sigma-E family)